MDILFICNAISRSWILGAGLKSIFKHQIIEIKHSKFHVHALISQCFSTSKTDFDVFYELQYWFCKISEGVDKY